jgi:hypothetical protein
VIESQARFAAARVAKTNDPDAARPASFEGDAFASFEGDAFASFEGDAFASTQIGWRKEQARSHVPHVAAGGVAGWMRGPWASPGRGAPLSSRS